MAEKGRSGRDSGPKGNPTQIQDHQKKIQDEEDRFERIWEELDNSAEDGSDIDPEKFLWEMDILDRLNPVPDFDLKSWEDVRKDFAPLLDDPDSADQQSSASDLEKIPKKRRSRKSIQAVIALVLVLAMLAMVTSCGVLERILRAIGIDAEEIFSFQLLEHLRVENPKPEHTDVEHYTSLEEALAAYNVTATCTDIQFPVGFSFVKVIVQEHSDAVKFVAVFSNDEDEIALTIWHYNDSTSLELQVAEKLPEDAEIYTKNGIDFYVMDNMGKALVVSWVTHTELYRISGDFSQKQAMQMIDSMD